jgi:glyceraldehyde-3-phosphate dehydrogenase (NADP+)
MTTTTEWVSDNGFTGGLSDWGLPGGSYVGGTWQLQNLLREVRDPETGELLAAVSESTAADVDRAVKAVAGALEDPWPVWARREALSRASELLTADSARFADIIRAESSKTIVEAEREVLRATETLRLSANATACLTGETLPLDDSPRGAGKVGWYSRRPVGIVAAVTPFNDPLNLVVHKLGPALVGGNGVVLKPSSDTPLSALALVDLLLEAGIPAGRLAVVCGGSMVGEALVAHHLVDLVSFTGGPQTAGRITSIAGPKKMMMELGGNNAVIVCDDANPAVAAKAIVAGAFGVAGQNCLSVQRVYIAEELFELVAEQVACGAKELVVGSKCSRETQVGPMISEGEADRVQEWVCAAVDAGAVLLAGGRREGAYYWPTVLTAVPGDDRLCREEVFGPVVTLQPFSELDQVVRLVNASEYALQAGVFTNSLPQAMSLADRINTGTVLINETSDFRIDAMPFGGFKRSGIGREGVRFAVEAMTEPKNTIINTLEG